MSFRKKRTVAQACSEATSAEGTAFRELAQSRAHTNGTLPAKLDDPAPRRGRKKSPEVLRIASSLRSHVDDETYQRMLGLNRQDISILEYLYVEGVGNGVCRACLGEATGVQHPPSSFRNLRDAGFDVPRKPPYQTCPTHGSQSHDALMAANVTAASRRRITLTPSQEQKVRAAIGNLDAFDLRPLTSREIEKDHKVPHMRVANAEAGIDFDDPASIRAVFQPLSQRNNMMKKTQCERCVQTGTRGRLAGLAVWFEGSEQYDEEIGCRGCPLAYPQEWRAHVEKLTATSAS